MSRGLLRRSPLKAGLLTSPKEHWPRFEGGLSMEVAGVTSDGRQMFRYTPSASYNVSLHGLHRFISHSIVLSHHQLGLGTLNLNDT